MVPVTQSSVYGMEEDLGVFFKNLAYVVENIISVFILIKIFSIFLCCLSLMMEHLYLLHKHIMSAVDDGIFKLIAQINMFVNNNRTLILSAQINIFLSLVDDGTLILIA